MSEKNVRQIYTGITLWVACLLLGVVFVTSACDNAPIESDTHPTQGVIMPPAQQPASPTSILTSTPSPTLIQIPLPPATNQALLPAPVSTAQAYPSPVPPSPTPTPLWDLRSLTSNASVVAQTQIIGSETRSDLYTFIFYVNEWYKNEPGVKDNIVRLTLDKRKNWDGLPYLPRNLIGSEGPSPFNFMLFLAGSPDNYTIVGDTAGVFYLRDGVYQVEGVEAGAGAEQYQNMPVMRFREELLAVLPATPTPLPASSTPLPTPADGSPISLIKVGDDYQVYPHRGIVRFGVGGMETWVGPSKLQVLWSSSKEPYEGASYLADLQSGTLEKYDPTPAWYSNTGGYSSVSHPDGKRVLLLKGATEEVWGLTYYDIATGQEQTVYDRDPAVTQWAGADAHEGLSPGSPTWLDEDSFILPLGPSPATGNPAGKSKLLLVNVSSHEVRVLAKEGGNYSAGYGAPLVYQSGDISSPLLMLVAPYSGKPVTLAPGGPWIRDWTATPDGKRVAWIEATAPPGDWSDHLPSPCITCDVPRDPEPEVQAIAIWSAASGQVYRYKPSNLEWSLSGVYFVHWRGLYWWADGSALLYATHDPGSPGRSTLYALSPGGHPEILAEHQGDRYISFVGEGQEGSLYYYLFNYVADSHYYESGDLMQRHPDGGLQTLHKDILSSAWWAEPDKWLEVLQEGGVIIYDLATGSVHNVHFSDHSPSLGELGSYGVQNLVPISPDGKWAAYAGSNNEALGMTSEGRPDRGPGIQITRIK